MQQFLARVAAIACSILFTAPLPSFAQSNMNKTAADSWNVAGLPSSNAAAASLQRAVAAAAMAASSPPSFTPDLVSQDAPGSGGAVQGPDSDAAQQKSFASIAGTVRDTRGAALPGVQVTLTGQNNAVDRVVTADSQGAFTFAKLAPGTYRVKVNAAGVEPSASAPVVLGAGEKRELTVVAVRIPVKTTTVRVVATPAQVAQAQVHQQEKQRIAGIL
ncbi:MAG: carboxypeptidase regulatory-like domain-containing protein, partial [Bryobacteraceae bacterium]